MTRRQFSGSRRANQGDWVGWQTNHAHWTRSCVASRWRGTASICVEDRNWLGETRWQECGCGCTALPVIVTSYLSPLCGKQGTLISPLRPRDSTDNEDRLDLSSKVLVGCFTVKRHSHLCPYAVMANNFVLNTTGGISPRSYNVSQYQVFTNPPPPPPPDFNDWSYSRCLFLTLLMEFLPPPPPKKKRERERERGGEEEEANNKSFFD